MVNQRMSASLNNCDPWACHPQRTVSLSRCSNSACVQAQATQEANRAASNRWPPLWAIGAMLVLGADEFLAVLYNPLWLVLGLLIFLFIKSVYQVGSAAWHPSGTH